MMKTENELIKECSQRLSDEINFDIEFGTYDHFEVLKRRLRYISDKLFKMRAIVNADELSQGEIKTLADNDYYY